LWINLSGPFHVLQAHSLNPIQSCVHIYPCPGPTGSSTNAKLQLRLRCDVVHLPRRGSRPSSNATCVECRRFSTCHGGLVHHVPRALARGNERASSPPRSLLAGGHTSAKTSPNPTDLRRKYVHTQFVPMARRAPRTTSLPARGGPEE
jgi:hypothetical protein